MKRLRISRQAFRRFAIAGCLLALCGWLASRKSPPRALGEMTNSIGMKLVLLPAGEFAMGSSESAFSWGRRKLGERFPRWVSPPEIVPKPDEMPLHRVRITRPFYIGAYELTKGQFAQFVKATGYLTGLERTASPYNWRGPLSQWDPVPPDDYPVTCVTWNDAVAFCEWISQIEGVIYRLPTEAEWEYACRAGTTTVWPSGNDPQRLTAMANVTDPDVACEWAPVGRLQPNSFGLYDMNGNAFEWCADWYEGQYYANSPTADPQGPMASSERAHRGGGCVAEQCRSAARYGGPPHDYGPHLGFRVVREASDK